MPLQDFPPAFIVNPLFIELGDNILNSVLNEDNILNTLVPDLVPNTNKLELLMYKV